jgi:hypothetical protein
MKPEIFKKANDWFIGVTRSNTYTKIEEYNTGKL